MSAFAIPSKACLRWRFAPYWARIGQHKRLILILALSGALGGVLISAATPEVYSARAVIRIDSPQSSCGGFVSRPVSPLPVRIATRLDSAAVWLGFASPKLEEKVSKWIENK